jgi:hypothetical protein
MHRGTPQAWEQAGAQARARPVRGSSLHEGMPCGGHMLTMEHSQRVQVIHATCNVHEAQVDGGLRKGVLVRETSLFAQTKSSEMRQ